MLKIENNKISVDGIEKDIDKLEEIYLAVIHVNPIEIEEVE